MREREWKRAERAALAKWDAETRAERAIGLSRCHNRTGYYGQWSEQGSLLAVKKYGSLPPIRTGQTRGCVTQFSAKSRRRMLRRFATVDRTALSRSLLVTLTYPRSFPVESSTFKRHFHTFSVRLRRTFPNSSAIWKLEFQQRGAPHYHLIVMGVPFLARQWLSRVWFEIVGSGDERHRLAGTQVQRCKSTRKALSYAAKYVAKVSAGEAPSSPGRFWGVIGRQSLASSESHWHLDRRGYSRLSRAIRNLAHSRRRVPSQRRYNASWIFCRGDRAAQLVRWAAGLPTDSPRINRAEDRAR